MCGVSIRPSYDLCSPPWLATVQNRSVFYRPHLTLATPSFAAAIAAAAAALQVPGVELGRRRGWVGAMMVKGVRRERRGARVAVRAAVERVVARVAAARVVAMSG